MSATTDTGRACGVCGRWAWIDPAGALGEHGIAGRQCPGTGARASLAGNLTEGARVWAWHPRRMALGFWRVAEVRRDGDAVRVNVGARSVARSGSGTRPAWVTYDAADLVEVSA